jgi:hypothetical protein
VHTDIEEHGALTRALRGLPADASQPYDFDEFERRRHAASARPRGDGRALAAAVVIAVAVCAAAIRLVGTATRPAAPPAVAANGSAAAAGSTRSEIVAARAADASAESWLASLPTEPAVVRVGTRAAVATLEDHIAQVDDLLSAGRVAQATPARLLALQQERAQLVSSLVQVRYAETLAYESR